MATKKTTTNFLDRRADFPIIGSKVCVSYALESQAVRKRPRDLIITLPGCKARTVLLEASQLSSFKTIRRINRFGAGHDRTSLFASAELYT